MRSVTLRANIVARLWLSDDGGSDEGGGGGGAPEWLPDGATGYADVLNGHYAIAGAEVTQSEFFDMTPEAGAGYVPVFDAEGVTKLADSHRIKLLDPALLSNCTVVIEVKTTDTANSGLLTFLTSGSDAVAELDIYDGQANFYNGPVTVDLYSGTFTADIVHRIAFTFDPVFGLAVSMDGGATAGPTWIAPEGAVATAELIAGPVKRFSKIEIYPPVSDADLPALSALS